MVQDGAGRPRREFINRQLRACLHTSKEILAITYHYRKVMRRSFLAPNTNYHELHLERTYIGFHRKLTGRRVAEHMGSPRARDSVAW